MHAIQSILETHPRANADDAIKRCIEQCITCAATCTSCADACLAEESVSERARRSASLSSVTVVR